jgi:uncharacterized protein
VISKNRVWLAAILLLIFTGIGLAWFWQYQNKPANGDKKMSSIEQIVIEGVAFKIELAITPKEKAKGLSGRETLCDQCGMLFIYDNPDYYSFWMKDTLIPLDIIWFSKDWQVVDYLAFAQPQGAREEADLPTYRPKQKAQFVLEVPGGTTKRITNFKIGSKASIL